MIIFLASAPILTYIFMKKNFEVLKTASFKMKYDSFYQNLDYFKKSAVPNTAFFLARRFLFAFTIVFCGSSIVLQVAIADMLSTGLICYYVLTWPMMSSSHNVV